MAHTHPATRVLPLFAMVLAALVIAAAVVIGSLALLPVSLQGIDAAGRAVPNPAIVSAEQEWERQRLHQSGEVDPDRAGRREWQLRKQGDGPSR